MSLHPLPPAAGVSFQGPGLLILAILGWAASKVLNDAPAWLSGIVAGERAGLCVFLLLCAPSGEAPSLHRDAITD